MKPSSTPTPCRLLVDPPASGAWNMAVDELLWRQTARAGPCCLRFYRWSEPTLSLGYFQSYESRRRHSASQDRAVVRRISGGGAILHDLELTYSFVAPDGHPLAARRLFLYRAVHGALIEALAELGVEASLWDDTQRLADTPVNQRAEQPFLCFQRRSVGDVLVGHAKIAGSAQRRSRGAVLQHGGVLLKRSASAPELAGLAEQSTLAPDGDRLIHAWRRSLACRLHLVLDEKPLDADERGQGMHLAETKYDTDHWTQNRSR